MSTIVRWIVLLFAVYVLSALIQFYFDAQGNIVELSAAGIRRMVLLVFSAAACIVLSWSLYRNRPSSDDQESSSESPVSRSGDTATDHPACAHPLKRALERHPWHLAMLVTVALCVPLVLRLTVSNVSTANTWDYWRPVLLGEMLAVSLLGAGVLVGAQKHRKNP
jgi:hypothetical protein